MGDAAASAIVGVRLGIGASAGAALLPAAARLAAGAAVRRIRGRVDTAMRAAGVAADQRRPAIGDPGVPAIAVVLAAVGAAISTIVAQAIVQTAAVVRLWQTGHAVSGQQVAARAALVIGQAASAYPPFDVADPAIGSAHRVVGGARRQTGAIDAGFVGLAAAGVGHAGHAAQRHRVAERREHTLRDARRRH